MPVIPGLEDPSQEELKASLGYTVTLCLRKTKTSCVCNPSYLECLGKKKSCKFKANLGNLVRPCLKIL